MTDFLLIMCLLITITILLFCLSSPNFCIWFHKANICKAYHITLIQKISQTEDSNHTKHEDIVKLRQGLKNLTSEVQDVMYRLNNHEKLNYAETDKIINFYNQLTYMSRTK